MSQDDTAPITREEMMQLFGDEMPIEAVQLLWSEPDETTFGQLRAKLRAIAHSRKVDLRLMRVARAICIADGRDPDSDWRQQGPIFLTVHDPEPWLWRRYIKHAQAALDASED